MEKFEVAKDGNISFSEAEKKIFGATHAEVGAYLAGLWGLPDPIVEGLAFHHQPAKCQARDSAPCWPCMRPMYWSIRRPSAGNR